MFSFTSSALTGNAGMKAFGIVGEEIIALALYQAKDLGRDQYIVN